jgi:hypothetical protein
MKQIQQGAQCRLAKAKVEESVFARRRRQLREATEAQMQEQARRYMRLQEKKQRELAAEREWRRANVYVGTKDQKVVKKNAFSELRQKFLTAMTSQPPVEQLRPPIPIAEVITEGKSAVSIMKTNTKPKVAKSYEPRPARVAMPIITAASIDQARAGHLRPKLPLVGRGKTKIPQLRP